MPIAYLIESTHITSTFQLKGKSVRAYEVNAEYKIESNSRYGYPQWCLKPTGYVYSIKDGKIVKSRTKATLVDKYVSGHYSQEILTSIRPDQAWSASLYASPELALGAKYLFMQRNASKAQQTLDNYQQSLTQAINQIPDVSFIMQEHPELFI